MAVPTRAEIAEAVRTWLCENADYCAERPDGKLYVESYLDPELMARFATMISDLTMSNPCDHAPVMRLEVYKPPTPGYVTPGDLILMFHCCAACFTRCQGYAQLMTGRVPRRIPLPLDSPLRDRSITPAERKAHHAARDAAELSAVVEAVTSAVAEIRLGNQSLKIQEHVASKLSVSTATAGRMIREAKDAGLLPDQALPRRRKSLKTIEATGDVL